MDGRVVDVGPSSAFEEAVPTVVQVDAREVIVVRWEGEFYALRNVCPHQAQSFVHGRVCPGIEGKPGGELKLTSPVLVCPWHTWPFDLRTGACTVDPLKRVRAFRVEVSDDRVLIHVDAP